MKPPTEEEEEELAVVLVLVVLVVLLLLFDLCSGSSFDFSATAAAKDVATELSTFALSFSLFRVLRAIASSSAAFCRAFLLASSCKCR